jgi:hypothetical protein
MTFSKRKRRPSGWGLSDHQPPQTTRGMLTWVVLDINSRIEIKPRVGWGPLHRHGHATVISHGVQTTGLNRPSSSQHPSPSLESGGNARVPRMGRRYFKITAPAVREPLPARAEVGRWASPDHCLAACRGPLGNSDPCRTRRKAGGESIRSDQWAAIHWDGWSATSGASCRGWRHHALTAPTWSARTRSVPLRPTARKDGRGGVGGGEDTRLGWFTATTVFAGWCA